MEKKGSSWGTRPTIKTGIPIDAEALDQFVNGPAARPKNPVEEPKVRLNVLLSESLHQRVKVACAIEKTSMTDVIVAYLESRFPAK